MALNIEHSESSNAKGISPSPISMVTLLCSTIALFSAIMLNAVQNESGYGKELFELLMPFSNIFVIILMVYVTGIKLWANIKTASIFVKDNCLDEEIKIDNNMDNKKANLNLNKAIMDDNKINKSEITISLDKIIILLKIFNNIMILLYLNLGQMESVLYRHFYNFQ